MLLSDILKEITIKRGQASNNTSVKLLDELIFYYKKELSSLMPSDNWDTTPMPKAMQDFLRSKAIQSSDNLIMVLYKGETITSHILINTDPDIVINMCVVGLIQTVPASGKWSLKTIYDIKAPKISFSEVSTEYRGKGYGGKMYDMFMNHYGIVQSDNTLYTGAYNMWTNYIPRIATRICGLIGSININNRNVVVVPLDEQDLADKKFLINAVRNIIAIKGSIPPALSKNLSLIEGLSLRSGTLQLISITKDLKSKVFAMDADDAKSNQFLDFDTFIQQCSAADYTLEELITAVSQFSMTKFEDIYTNKHVKSNDSARVVVFLLNDATAYVREAGDGLEVLYAG